jgi:hypothetical protein
MEVQVFGRRNCPDTRKALRFFAERRVKSHFVDLDVRPASPGELRRFVQKFGVEALLDAGGASAEGKVEKSVTAPVGSLGVYGRFLSGDRWQFDADARVFALEIDRFDITVLELGGAARYALSRKFSLELGYSGSGITVDVLPEDGGGGDESRLEGGKIKYSLQSLRFGATWVP